MNALITIFGLATALGIALFVPTYGASAVLICAVVAVIAGLFVNTVELDKQFLLRIFIVGVLVRMLIGTLIFSLHLQEFFGGDANTYDYLGNELLAVWQGNTIFISDIEVFSTGGGWGMLYLVGAIYAIIGRNPLAVQFVNAVLGAATAPLVYLCAQHMFRNLRVARIAAFFVVFYPSLVLWSSQGLKDAPIVFLLVAAMYATLKLGEKLNIKYFLILVAALFGILSLRFYIFYMITAAIAGAFVIGMRRFSAQSVARQAVALIAIGLALTYLGVLRTASAKLEIYGNLEAIQRSRSDLALTATSGFSKDVDVTTTAGALTALPVGMVYLLFAPFPWQLANLRQSITLPEMLIWWASFPMLILGLWFTVRYRLRQAFPILIFTTMLTLSYSIFQGNIGTAYRQRSQLLVFYFMFVAVGIVLFKEKKENAKLARMSQS
ncbi:MAG TPA: glycosyltransferase family 39 protein [Pyrinomonadaceae bacterium]|jgi:4-amino-4-deoxy-L-arabinose transferase-like glycosyltransferase|nr:glycosyltransferase family 39 protein [Pyrinomonadaceae bacterium]